MAVLFAHPQDPVALCPQKNRAAGRTDRQQLPLHRSREESHLQPLLKAEREAPPSSAAYSRVRRIQRENQQQNKSSPNAR